MWFGPNAFYPAWKRAMGSNQKSEAANTQNMALIFGLTLIGIITQVIVLALIFDLLERATGGVTLGVGMGVSLIVGIGAAATSLGHRMFAGHGLKAWGIEVGNDVLNYLLMGFILSLFY